MIKTIISAIFMLFLSIQTGETQTLSTQLFYAPEYKTLETVDLIPLRIAKWATPHQKKGTIVFMEGMGGFVESYEKFCCWFVDQGYDVLTFDWRGQGASGRVTLKETLLHIESFDDYIHDLEDILEFHEEETTTPLIFVASSMGGNIALRYIDENPEMVDGLILLSPMVDINTAPYPYPIARGIANIAYQLGAGENFVFGYNKFSLESCLERYDPTKNGEQKQYIHDCNTLHQQPNMAVGGPSFNWLLSAFQSCDELKECEFSSLFHIPILMVSVERDHLVDTQAQIELCKRISSCRQILYDDERTHHNLVHDHESVFERLTGDIKEFLKDQLGL